MFDLVEALWLTRPQICPNFVWMALGLIVVAKEQKFELILMDLVRLCVVKANSKHDPKCFYLSKAVGMGVISGGTRGEDTFTSLSMSIPLETELVLSR